MIGFALSLFPRAELQRLTHGATQVVQALLPVAQAWPGRPWHKGVPRASRPRSSMAGLAAAAAMFRDSQGHPLCILCQDIVYTVYQDILYTSGEASGRNNALRLPKVRGCCCPGRRELRGLLRPYGPLCFPYVLGYYLGGSDA